MSMVSVQVITTIPMCKLPKKMLIGATSVDDMEKLDEKLEEMDEIGEDSGARGRILWIRGLRRLQSQVYRIRLDCQQQS